MSLFPQCPCSSRMSVRSSSSRCLCIWFRGEPVTSVSSFSMACGSVVSHWCKWWTFMLPCSQHALILVLEHVGNFGVIAVAWLQPPWCQCTLCIQMLSLYAAKWPALPKCMQLILVSWYVASMLCCHYWMFSLSDALPMQSYPSKVWVLCQWGRADLCAA